MKLGSRPRARRGRRPRSSSDRRDGAFSVQVRDRVEVGFFDRQKRCFDCVGGAYLAAADGVSQATCVLQPRLHIGASITQRRSVARPRSQYGGLASKPDAAEKVPDGGTLPPTSSDLDLLEFGI